MNLSFGTDGVRGEAFTVLTEEYVRALGAAASRVFDCDTILVGRDTRESGPALQQAFAEGCASEGVSITDLGVAPTPAVAWLANAGSVPAAVLSASHNPWQDNGIKLFGAGGLKLTDAEQDEIERQLASGLSTDEIVEPTIVEGSIDRYIDAVVDSIDGRNLAGTRVVLDCANGAASATAGAIFARLQAEVVVLAADPDGQNINNGVGSTHPEFLAAAVREHGASLGFAFDGDADRVMACDSNGTVIDGDRIIAMGAIDRRDSGQLPHNTVVITVMTNLGFRVAMAENGIELVETGVGDRHVLEALDAGGFALGGEQSGHIIHRDLATTGDGVLSAVQLMDSCIRRGVDLGDWSRSVMTSYPQVLENVRIAERIANPAERIADAIAAEEAVLGDRGRVLIRASGTEPLIRVMVEAADEETARNSAMRLVDAVRLMADHVSAD